jgi:hypothetical protein
MSIGYLADPELTAPDSAWTVNAEGRIAPWAVITPQESNVTKARTLSVRLLREAPQNRRNSLST